MTIPHFPGTNGPLMAEKKKLGPGRHRSAIKRNKQNALLKKANHATRSSVRSVVKKVRAAIEKKELKEATTLFLKAQSMIDRTVKKGLLHRRTGQRQIARLHRAVSQISAS